MKRSAHDNLARLYKILKHELKCNKYLFVLIVVLNLS